MRHVEDASLDLLDHVTVLADEGCHRHLADVRQLLLRESEVGVRRLIPAGGQEAARVNGRRKMARDWDKYKLCYVMYVCVCVCV